MWNVVKLSWDNLIAYKVDMSNLIMYINLTPIFG